MNKRFLISISAAVVIILVGVLVYLFSAGNNLPASTAVGGADLSGVCYANDNLPLAVTDADTCLQVLGGNAWSPSSALEDAPEQSTDTVVVYSCERDGSRNLLTTQQEALDCAGFDYLTCEYQNRAAYDRNEASYCSDRVRQWRIKFGLE